MAEIRGIEVVVFDVLGTMVDEPGGLRSAVQEATGLPDAAVADELVPLAAALYWRRALVPQVSYSWAGRSVSSLGTWRWAERIRWSTRGRYGMLHR
ncbi:hypothetical protein [Streptomyces luteogriseus]|uniref:hypothetical protein n=1 Tax=Streptomyces luteogriseus TaxID=68233 RepID=UPI0038203589